MFFIQFKPPQSTAERYWNVVENWLGLLTLLTPIVLKLTGVITWSWWWVALSPIWISVALLVLLSPWWVTLSARRARLEASEAGSHDASDRIQGCTLWETTLQREVPREVLSRVSAYDWFGSVAFVPLGYLIAAPIAALLGIRTTLFFATAWAAGSCAIVLTIPSIRNLRREARPNDASGRGQARLVRPQRSAQVMPPRGRRP